MIRPIYIVGAGGHSRVLLECLQQNSEINIAGFLEVDLNLIGTVINKIPIYAQDVILKQYGPNDIFLVNGIGSIDIPKLRYTQFKKIKLSGYSFLSVIHRTAYCSSDVVIEEGAHVLARSTILTGSKIGSNTIVNTSASIDHDCVIGSHSHIAPGVILSGGVEIGDACHIGAGAIIIQGVRIGQNSLVSAGAVVTKSFPENSRILGVPAKNIARI